MRVCVVSQTLRRGKGGAGSSVFAEHSTGHVGKGNTWRDAIFVIMSYTIPQDHYTREEAIKLLDWILSNYHTQRCLLNGKELDAEEEEEAEWGNRYVPFFYPEGGGLPKLDSEDLLKEFDKHHHEDLPT